MHDAKTLAAELMAAAEKATPQGKWRFSPWHIEEGASAVRAENYGIVCTTAGDNTAQFIALCSPDNIRTLCEAVLKGETAATNASGAAVERSQSQRQLPALPQQGSPEFTASEMLDKDRQLSALQEEVGRLREALEPFADYASQDGFGLDYHGRELPDGDGPGWVYVTNGDFRRARSALARTAGGKDGELYI